MQYILENDLDLLPINFNSKLKWKKNSTSVLSVLGVFFFSFLIFMNGEDFKEDLSQEQLPLQPQKSVQETKEPTVESIFKFFKLLIK